MGKKKNKLLSAGAIKSEGFNEINEEEREDFIQQLIDMKNGNFRNGIGDNTEKKEPEKRLSENPELRKRILSDIADQIVSGIPDNFDISSAFKTWPDPKIDEAAVDNARTEAVKGDDDHRITEIRCPETPSGLTVNKTRISFIEEEKFPYVEHLMSINPMEIKTYKVVEGDYTKKVIKFNWDSGAIAPIDLDVFNERYDEPSVEMDNDEIKRAVKAFGLLLIDSLKPHVMLVDYEFEKLGGRFFDHRFSSFSGITVANKFNYIIYRFFNVNDFKDSLKELASLLINGYVKDPAALLMRLYNSCTLDTYCFNETDVSYYPTTLDIEEEEAVGVDDTYFKILKDFKEMMSTFEYWTPDIPNEFISGLNHADVNIAYGTFEDLSESFVSAKSETFLGKLSEAANEDDDDDEDETEEPVEIEDVE